MPRRWRLLVLEFLFRRIIFVAVAALVVSSAAAQEERVCTISPLQMSPPRKVGVRGAGAFTLDTSANTLLYSIQINSRTGEESARICGPASPGHEGATQFQLPLGSIKRGAWNYPERLEEAILNGSMYVQIDGASHQQGRGEISSAVADFQVQQSYGGPPSRAAGFGLFNLERDQNILRYHLQYFELNGIETGAAIHGYAPPPMTAGVVHSMPLGSTKTGHWKFAEDEELPLRLGMAYVQIFSEPYHSAGELRGQIIGPKFRFFDWPLYEMMPNPEAQAHLQSDPICGFSPEAVLRQIQEDINKE